MSLLSSILLGLIQGLAEFLPISSSGHLAIAEHFLGQAGVPATPDFFDVLLHLGTLVAVFAAYWQDIRDMIVELIDGVRDLVRGTTPNPIPPARRMILLIIVGTLPLFVVLPVKDLVEGLSGNIYFVAGALIVTGFLLFASYRVKKGRKTERSAKLLAVLLAVWMAAAGALGAAAQEEKKQVAMSFTARSALLMEQQTGKVLFSQNETQRVAPASLTKLMDLLLIFQQLQSGKLTMEQELTCSAYAKTMGGSEIWLKVVASANDAAVVFAEAIAASEEEFVRLMNEKAQQLGLQNTHFVNCTGFDEEGHYTCAQDVAVLARELMTGYGEQLTRFSTIWMDSLRGGETQLVNTNRLIRFYDGATGLKTGTTDAAGHCLCATATRDGLSLISVIMGCKSSDARFEESRQLLDYGFAGFTLYQPQLPQDRLHPVAVKQGMQTQVEPQVEALPQAVVRKNEVDGIEIKLELSEQLQAPVAKGQAIGWIQLVQNGSIIAQQPVTAGQEVQQLTYAKSLRLLAKGLIGMNGQSVCEQVE